MFTALVRIFKYGFSSFWRSGLLTTATVAIMVVALSVFSGLIFFNVVTKTALTSLQDKIDITVYFKTDADEAAILQVKSAIENLDETQSVAYISRTEALDTFREKHKNDTVVISALDALGDNPLQASLNIKAKDPRQYATIASYFDTPSVQPIVDKVSYQQNEVVINRLIKVIDTAERGGLIITILFLCIAGLVAFNTIRLAIYANREEIGVMRLVGALNSFISAPYVVQGILQGIVASFITLLIMLPTIHLVSPYIQAMIPEMDLWSYFVANMLGIFALQTLAGIVLGGVSSLIAVRRYLKA
ncbi:MAG: ABC transporter permease [Patescibacteria group bacterium]|nr:ABC transporter permease [Patescibacteria group bacterium]MDE2437981.1 ABC transporter permease [Patescibacteria group bacterium]